MSRPVENCDVTSEHLNDETVLIDLGHGKIISDHPIQSGGSEKGPAPGELMKGALASSIALAIGDAVERGEVSARYVGVRCSSSVAFERLEGPLPALTYLPDFVAEIVIGGELEEAEKSRLELIARDCDVARALTDDLTVEETNEFEMAPAVRPARGNSAVLDGFFARRPAEGEYRRTEPAKVTAVFAEFLGGGRALVTWSHSAYLVEASPSREDLHGTSPDALLFASLAACTSVFTARAGNLAGAEVEIRVACKGDLRAGQSNRIEKRLQVTGQLDDAKRDTIAFFADHCSLGETLRRRANLRIEIRSIPSENLQGANGPHFAAGRSEAEDILGEPACDDGLCCVPAMTPAEDREP